MQKSDAKSFNVAIVRGVCSSPPELRVLPSDQRLAQLQLTTRVDGRAMSVPVSVLDPPAWLEELDAGDELVVLGAGPAAVLPRRRARPPRGWRSRPRSCAGPATGAARRGLRRRIEELLDALEA